MIGRVWDSGRGFKGAFRYMLTGEDGLARVEDRVAWMGFANLPTRDPEVAACMMAATASASVSNCQTPLYHFTISCAPDDPVDRDTFRRIAARTIRDLGLQEYEVAVFAHKDRPHPHLHFLVNRVHPERRTLWSPWRSKVRIEKSLRAQEQELGLRVVPGWLAPVPEPDQGRARAVQGPQREAREPQRERPRPGPKRGDAAFLADMQKRALPVLEQARSWSDLLRGLAEQEFTLRAKGGGFRMGDDTRDRKASDVAREFSRNHLEDRFGPYPDYLARVAVAVPTPAPSAPEVARDTPARREIPAPAPADPPARTVEPAPTPRPVEHATGAPEPARPTQPPARPVEAPAPPSHPSRTDPAPRPIQPPPARPVEPRPPARPVAPPASPSHRSRTEPAPEPSQPPPARPVEPPRPPRQLTEREHYRVVLGAFTAELAALYRDPRAARRSFAADLSVRGSAEAVGTLAARPEKYGRLRVLANRERASEAAKWAEHYARWQEGRTRPVARIVADLYHAAEAVDSAGRARREAEANAHKAADDRAWIADRQRRADEAGRPVLDRASSVYADPADAGRAIARYTRVHGREAMYEAVKRDPERFGRLRAETRRIFGIIPRRDTTRARMHATLLTDALRYAYASLDARPTPEEVARADEAQRAAAAALEAATRWHRALPAVTARVYREEAARIVRHAVRGSPARERTLMRQLGPMLTHGAFSLARKALDERKRDQERERRRDRGVGLGF